MDERCESVHALKRDSVAGRHVLKGESLYLVEAPSVEYG